MSAGNRLCSVEMPAVRSVECINDCSLDEDPKPQLPVTRSEILDSITIVRTCEDSKKIVNHLLQCHQTVAIDVKGRDLGKRNGKISLIAVATCNGRCLLFDIHSNNQLVAKGRLKSMLQCKELIKVMHDCCLIRSALEQCYGVKVRSIFDTQVAHAVIEGHRSGKNPRCIPYETPLFISYTYGRCVLTPADHALEKLYLENCNFWDVRPLPCKQKEYAARGVLALIPEAYNNMNRRLQGPLRKTFRTMCQGKCIELAADRDRDSLSVQGRRPSLMGESSQKCKKRALSVDRQCRSCSTSSTSMLSERNSSSCFRCTSAGSTSPPRKKVKKIAKFSVSPRRSISASLCGAKRKRLVVRKTTKTACNCVTCISKPGGRCGSKKGAPAKVTENCKCVKTTKTVWPGATPKYKKCGPKVTCKRKKPMPVCKKRRSSCASLVCVSSPRPKKPMTVCKKRRSSCASRGYASSPRQKKPMPVCKKRRSSCASLACASSPRPKKPKTACKKRRSSCASPRQKKPMPVCKKRRSSCASRKRRSSCASLACAPSPRQKTPKPVCKKRRSSCASLASASFPKRKRPSTVCKKRRSSCASLACASSPRRKKPKAFCKKRRSSCASLLACAPIPRRKSRVRSCAKKKTCPKRFSPQKILSAKKKCVKSMKPKKKKKCPPLRRSNPYRSSSTCLCKTVGKRGRPPVRSASLVRRGWKEVMDMEVMDNSDDETMETDDDDDETDFENEMMPPAAKRKR